MTVYIKELCQFSAAFGRKDKQPFSLAAPGATFHAESLIHHAVASVEHKNLKLDLY